MPCYTGCHQKVRPGFRVDRPAPDALIKKTPHRCAQLLGFSLIPDAVNFTTKINHHACVGLLVLSHQKRIIAPSPAPKNTAIKCCVNPEQELTYLSAALRQHLETASRLP